RRTARGFTAYPFPDPKHPPSVRCLYRDRRGDLWIGLTEGLARYRNDHLELLGQREGFAARYVVSFYEDREGSLWIGTDGAGLYRFKDSPLVTHRPDNLSDPLVETVVGGRDGGLWVGTSGGTVARLRGGRFEPLALDASFPSTGVRTIVDAKNGLW